VPIQIVRFVFFRVSASHLTSYLLPKLVVLRGMVAALTRVVLMARAASAVTVSLYHTHRTSAL
jgi:hypothetical protein